MTLQQLKYADAIADCGSISEAARRVFVTQPTLTESVRLLEEELRIAIFNRSSRWRWAFIIGPCFLIHF